jgi:hypothetical protein
MMRNLLPYFEGVDPFIFETGGMTARLHLDPSNGHAQFMPIPDSDDLSNFYNSQYKRPDHSTPQAEYDRASEVATGLISYLKDSAGISPPFTAHDVGCAFGALTYGFLHNNIVATGNDASHAMVDAGNHFCRGALSAKPLSEALEDIPYKLDLVTILHSLEHMQEPQQVLQTIFPKLSGRGVVYICVPNGHSLQAMVGGRRQDPCINFPGHLHYFTPKSLVEHIEEAGFLPLSLSTRYLPSIEGGLKGLQALLGAPESLMPSPASWVQAICENLLGYEIFLLACHPDNRSALRAPDVKSRAEQSFNFFKACSRYESHVM